MDVVIRRAATEEVIDLRHQVLRVGLPRDTALFPGDDAATSIHLIATADGQTIGCATLHLNQWNNAPAYQLRGMAVAPAHQKHGIGAKLLEAIDAMVSQTAVTQLWCNARTPAAAFYQKHGWQIASEPFDIPTAGPHVKMIKPGFALY